RAGAGIAVVALTIFRRASDTGPRREVGAAAVIDPNAAVVKPPSDALGTRRAAALPDQVDAVAGVDGTKVTFAVFRGTIDVRLSTSCKRGNRRHNHEDCASGKNLHGSSRARHTKISGRNSICEQDEKWTEVEIALWRKRIKRDSGCESYIL